MHLKHLTQGSTPPGVTDIVLSGSHIAYFYLCVYIYIYIFFEWQIICAHQNKFKQDAINVKGRSPCYPSSPHKKLSESTLLSNSSTFFSHTGVCMCIYVSERLSMYVCVHVYVCTLPVLRNKCQYRGALEIPLFSGLVACATVNQALFSWQDFSCSEFLSAGRESSCFVLYLPTCVTGATSCPPGSHPERPKQNVG